MNISYGTVPGETITDNGYGFAGYNIINTLKSLGHTVEYSRYDFDLQFNFSQPTWYKYHKDQYKIGYTPWESSELPPGWRDRMNENDEIWAPTEKVIEWYAEAGVNVPLKVYEHGINPIFTPKKRATNKKIKFLHIGEPAPRKGGQMALDAFRAAFGNQDDVELTIKSWKGSLVRAYGIDGGLMGPPTSFNNVKLLDGSVPTDQIVSMYHNHHCLVYPSWGEGFGLIPLEAIATGMPTICTSAWAPYKEFILGIDSSVAQSPWPRLHSGNMFEPDFDHLVERYRQVYENFDSLANKFYARSWSVHERFNWEHLTKNAFKELAEKF